MPLLLTPRRHHLLEFSSYHCLLVDFPHVLFLFQNWRRTAQFCLESFDELFCSHLCSSLPTKPDKSQDPQSYVGCLAIV